jgi:hypothetical protein
MFFDSDVILFPDYIEKILRFDENLLGYAYMEDVLFSHLLYRKFLINYFITPYAMHPC